jgi:hypothetical protein
MYAGVALAVALVCLFLGFFWGRSNVRSKVEQALEQEHVALDAREFGMRQQLDDAFAEVARLRPLAEEVGRVQERLRIEQTKYAQVRAELNTMLGIDEGLGSEEVADQPEEPAPAPESADEAIQRLLQSLETFNAPGEQKRPAHEESQRMDDRSQPPHNEQFQASLDELNGMNEQPQSAYEELPIREEQPQPPYEEPQMRPELPGPVEEHVPARSESLSVHPHTEPSAPRKVAIGEGRKRSPGGQMDSESRPQTADEWQEFARSLADLTRRNQ